jgi:hypothetical protein
MSLEDAVHVTHGDAAAAGLRAVGAKNVIVWRDLLTIGRCDADPAVHRRERAAHWGVPIDDWVDLDVALAGARELVIWSRRNWSDRVYFWALCDKLAKVSNVRVCEPETDADGWSGALKPERLRAAWQAVRPLDPATAAEARALWAAYVSPSPVAFDGKRRAGSMAFPELSRIAVGHGDWFPGRAADGRLRLSDVDDRLFHWIDEEWRSGVDLLKTPGARAPVSLLMSWLGDNNVFRRLTEWARLGAVETRGDHDQVREFSVRMTEAGRRLHDEGAASVAELAPVWIGGCYINDAKRPWVRVTDGEDWKIVTG